MVLNPSYVQNNCTNRRDIPKKPRPRASLPGFNEEMSQKRYEQRQRNSSLSSSDESSSDEDSNYSNSCSPNSSTSQSPTLREISNYSHSLNTRNIVKRQTPNATANKSDSERLKNINTSVNRKISHSKNNESGSKNSIALVISLITIILLSVLLVQNIYKTPAETINNLNKDEVLKNVRDEIRLLKKEFRNQEKEIWQEIYSGFIDVINNPKRPSIFVLFADRDDLMNCLALTIGELGRMAFGTKSSLKLKPTQLEHDTGEVIEKLRSAIPEQKSVIFWDFLSINDKALNAFHFICDRENPLVKQAIYVITVKAKGYNGWENPLQFIENKLISNLTGRIKDDSLMPLITRITDGPIISVKPEFNMQCRYKNTINY